MVITMNEFKKYHPIVNFCYFVLVIGFSMFFMHPIAFGISFACGFLYSVMIKGRKAIKQNLLYIIPILLLTALINPLFSHEGMTVLAYLPNGNPLTKESVFYGISAAVMLVSVICWFSSFNEIMTSDKIIYLFGKLTPALSLIISMVLRFVPRFSAQLKLTAKAQRCIGKDMSNGNIIERAKHGLNILSAMVTWSLENAIETADSMKSRGYGTAKRSAFSVFKFDKRDKNALSVLAVLGIYTLIGGLSGGMYFRFFPTMKSVEISVISASVFISYLMLSIYPIITDIIEVRKWNVTR